MIYLILKTLGIIAVECMYGLIAFGTGVNQQQKRTKQRDDMVIELTIKALQATDPKKKQDYLNVILEQYPDTILIRRFKQWK